MRMPGSLISSAWDLQWEGAGCCAILQAKGAGVKQRGGLGQATGWGQGNEGQGWRGEQGQCFIEHLLCARLSTNTTP